MSTNKLDYLRVCCSLPRNTKHCPDCGAKIIKLTLKELRQIEIDKIKVKFKAFEQIFNGEPAATVAKDLGLSANSIGFNFRKFCRDLNPDEYKRLHGSGCYKEPLLKNLIENQGNFFRT